MKPENSVWNEVDTIVQTLEDDVWKPSNASVYNLSPSTTDCRFNCEEGYEWDGDSCELYDVTSINNEADLRALEGIIADGNYRLENDIDLGGGNWTPITNLSGIFDGNEKIISNFMGMLFRCLLKEPADTFLNHVVLISHELI